MVAARLLLLPGAETTLVGNTLTLAIAGHQASFDFSGQASFEEGLISFQRNVAVPTKIFCLRGENVQIAVFASAPMAGGLRVEVSAGYPYRKRELIAQRHPNSRLQQVSVKKLQFAMMGLLLVDFIVLSGIVFLASR